MKLKEHLFRRSIFIRLMTTFLVILLPVFAISAAIHQWGVVIIRNEILNSMKSRMEYQKTILENELNRILYLQYDCLSDQDLQRLANFPAGTLDFDTVQSINRLQHRLNTLKNSSIYIEDVRAIIPLLHKTISVNEGVSAMSETDRKIINSLTDKSSRLDNVGNQLFARARNISVSSRKLKPHYVIEISFSNQKLESFFMNFNDYKGGGMLIYSPLLNFSLSAGMNATGRKLLRTSVQEYKDLPDHFNKVIDIDSEKQLAFFTRLKLSPIWLAANIPEKQAYSPLSKYLYLLWVFALMVIIIIVFFSISTHRMLQKPLRKLVRAFRRVEQGDLKFAIEHPSNDEFQYLYARFNAMLEYISNLIDQVYAQKIMSQKAELRQLQSQINPHFLFNSFFILQRMIQGEDVENAACFCSYLGQYFQYVTRNSMDDMALAKEVEHARNYLEIQAIRFSNIEVEFEELPEKFKQLLVPRLVLQPIIENAFEHGFNKDRGQRSISVRFVEEAGILLIVVEDNGSSLRSEELDQLKQRLMDQNADDMESTGLINIHRRIRIKFGENSGIEVMQGEPHGFKAIICLELKEEQDV